MKKLTSLFIAMVLVFSFTITSFAADVPNIDTASDWAKETIQNTFNGGFMDPEGLMRKFRHL